MITNFGNFTADCIPSEMIGLSTDEKPTDVCNASAFYEMDTRQLFRFDEEHLAWLNQMGGSGGGGGGASLETCTVTLFYGNLDEAAVTYTALVDGKPAAKVLRKDDSEDGYEFTITDIVKGSALSLFNEANYGAFAPNVDGEAEELYAGPHYRTFCYAINGDCSLSFYAD